MRDEEHVTDQGEDYEVYERKKPRPEIAPGSMPDTSRGGPRETTHFDSDPSDAPPDPEDGAWLMPTRRDAVETPAADTAPDAGFFAFEDPPEARPATDDAIDPAKSAPEPRRGGFLGGHFGGDPPADHTFDPSLLPDPPAEPLRVAAAAASSTTSPEPAPPARSSTQKTSPSSTNPAPRGDTMRIAIAATEFNYDITHMMVERAKAHAEFLGAEVTHVVRVPGVYDLPLLVKRLLRRADVDGVATLGVVIEGETDHDDLVIQHAARKIVDLSLEHDKPVGLGITGPGMSRLQAEARIDRAKDAVEAIVKLQRTLGAL